MSAFPITLPYIVDTHSSIRLAGWLGSVYFLAFGLAYPLLDRSFRLLCDLSHGQTLLFLRVVCIIAFALSSLGTAISTSASGVVLGRVFAGIGAAGSLCSISLHLRASNPANFHFSAIYTLIVYSLAQLLGPL
jgi:MFS family permease